MHIGTIIKNLRHKKGLTQEELAAKLGITSRAVSQWECEKTEPDISLIGPLCNLFDITSDELLGIDITRKQKEVDKLRKKADELSCIGDLDGARKVLKEGIKRYPGNFDIITDMLTVLNLQYCLTGDKRYLADAIEIGETILAQSTEEHQRNRAIQTLCFAYGATGRTDEAIKMALSRPFISESRELMLIDLYSGDRNYEIKQIAMMQLLQFLSVGLSSLQTKLDSGDYAYTEEECATIREKQIDLINLFFEDSCCGAFCTHLCEAHRLQAEYYASKGQDEKALEHLYAAVINATGYRRMNDRNYTSLVFRNLKPGKKMTIGDDIGIAKLRETMEKSLFDKARNSDLFVDITRIISEYESGNES